MEKIQEVRDVCILIVVLVLIVLGLFYLDDLNTRLAVPNEEAQLSKEVAEQMYWECDDLPLHSMVECVNDGKVIEYSQY